MIRDWAELPLTLNSEQVGELYGLSWRTVQRKIGTPAIPMPFQVHPYAWRKADVQAHYMRCTLSGQRMRMRADKKPTAVAS